MLADGNVRTAARTLWAHVVWADPHSRDGGRVGRYFVEALPSGRGSVPVIRAANAKALTAARVALGLVSVVFPTHDMLSALLGV